MAKTVLVTTDGSARSHRIIPHAGAFARAWGGRMLLCQVMDRKNDVVQEPGEAWDAAGARGKARIETELQALIARSDIEAGHMVVQPAQDESLPAAILRGAAEADAGIIAIESHGGGTIRSAILGSVAMGVVRAASIPVLVGGPQVEPVPPVGPYRIVATTDGSAESESIFRMLGPLLEGSDIEVEVLRVYSIEPGSTEQDMVARLRPQLEKVRGLLPASLKVELQLKQIAPGGGVDVAIVEQAMANNADVVAMSRHGTSARRTLLLGNTATLVLERSRLPVILARSEG